MQTRQTSTHSTRLPQHRAAAFRANKSGGVAITFALALVPVLGMVGAAVDYTHASQMRTLIQGAADAGVLSAAVRLTGAPANAVADTPANRAMVTSLVMANLTALDSNASPSVTPKITKTDVTATVSGQLPTAFLKILGITTITVGATSKALFVGPDDLSSAEVTLVLDATGSMGDNNKLDGAKAAATSLVNTLLPTNPASPGYVPPGPNDPNAKVRISVVPFSDYVNVGITYAGAPWLTSTADVVNTYPPGCYNTYPNAVYGPPYFHSATCSSDGVPYDCSSTYGDVVSYGAPVQQCYQGGSWNSTWVGCVGSRDYPKDLKEEVTAAQPEPAMIGIGCNNPLARLDSRNANLVAQIAALHANGETYMAPGLLWGWRTLSPLGPFADGKAYSKQAKKYLVLMTDGFNTRSPNYPYHQWGDSALADQLTLETCTAIKAAGVTVYTISFQVFNNLSAPMLKACATDAGSYYDASNNAALQQVFADIAAKISGGATKVHLVQ